MTEILNWIGALFISIGGASVVILGISKWFGRIMANKLLEKDKSKYSQELEELKSRYQKELEQHKADLEKSKALFLRYSEHQFTLYNEVWTQLCELKFVVEQLWKQAEPEKIIALASQIKDTKRSLQLNALLIEDDHYEQLSEILKTIGDFQVGKEKLIKLRNRQAYELEDFRTSIKQIVDQNGTTKDDLINLMERVRVSFKGQISSS